MACTWMRCDMCMNILYILSKSFSGTVHSTPCTRRQHNINVHNKVSVHIMIILYTLALSFRGFGRVPRCRAGVRAHRRSCILYIHSFVCDGSARLGSARLLLLLPLLMTASSTLHTQSDLCHHTNNRRGQQQALKDNFGFRRSLAPSVSSR